MPTTTSPVNRLPSPLRMVRAWLFRERAVRGPAAIELDVLDRQITREETAVRAAHDESAAIEQRLARTRRSLKAALTDDVTPGIIDATEARAIARELIGTSVATHHHTTHLEGLL